MMPLSPRISKEKREAQIDRILSAAGRCFARSGYRDATLEDIANEAALSKGGVYTHFATKEDVFLALSERAHRSKLEALQGVYNEQDSSIDKIRALWHRIIWSWAELDDLTRVSWEFWYHAARQQDVRLQAMLERRYRELERVFATVLEEGIRRGEVDAQLDVSIMTRLFWVLTDGLVGFWLARGLKPAAAELSRIEEAVDTIVRRSLRAPQGETNR